jgi:hypothetical protein
MKTLNRLVMFCLLALSACTSGTNETAYLRAAQDRVTQDEIRQRWGEPKKVASEGGSTVWAYEKREQQAGNRYTAPGMWCEEYVLKFDREGILRRWSHRSQFHGGELMPRECITGTLHPKEGG